MAGHDHQFGTDADIRQFKHGHVPLNVPVLIRGMKLVADVFCGSPANTLVSVPLRRARRFRIAGQDVAVVLHRQQVGNIDQRDHDVVVRHQAGQKFEVIVCAVRGTG